MENEIIEVIKEELELTTEINNNTNFKKDLDLDSLDVFQVSLALQQKYNIKINEKYDTVGELINIVEKKVG